MYMDSMAGRKHMYPVVVPPFQLALLCGYDPADATLHALADFATVASQTQCLFARAARIWGSADDAHGTVEAQVEASVRAFAFFSTIQLGVDAFVLALRGERLGDTVEHLARTVRHALRALARADPSGYDCMSKSFTGRRGWVFSFGREEMFVTVFAQCYASDHARFSFGIPDTVFILFQPYRSFLEHGVGHDTPKSATQWERPKTARDRIRVNFRAHNREYFIPEDVRCPVASLFVPTPLLTDGGGLEWWRDGEGSDSDA